MAETLWCRKGDSSIPEEAEVSDTYGKESIVDSFEMGII